MLEEHPGVREAAVVGVPDRRWGEIVPAVIVPADPAHPPDLDELRTHARARSPGSRSRPSGPSPTQLPRNATGKLLRRHLGRTARPNQ